MNVSAKLFSFVKGRIIYGESFIKIYNVSYGKKSFYGFLIG